MSKQQFPVNATHLERRADRAAPEFAGAGFVRDLTREGLLERLKPIQASARLVVDLGCAAGDAITPLEKRFPGARVVGVDRSLPLLQMARTGQRWLSRSRFLRSDPGALPFADLTVDVVFSNLALAAVDDPLPLGAEVNRVLRQDGLFAFVTLGPDSLGALRRAWAAVDHEPHVQNFLDMHDVGDRLVRAGLREPVLDVDRVELEYATTAALFRDLGATGARNALSGRRRSLTGRDRFARMTSALEAERDRGAIRIQLELVYGHCWGGGPVRRDSDVRIDAAMIPLRRTPR